MAVGRPWQRRYKSPMDMQGKCAVVTGGARGIGRAFAESFVAAGGRVLLLDRDEAALAALRDSLPAGSVQLVCGDVSEPEPHARAVAEAVAAFDSLTVWVNSAGLARHRWIVDYSPEDLDLMMAVNLKGTVLGSQAALRHMRDQGSGHIFNIASTAALRGIQTESFYCATKWAVRGFTEALCEEAAGAGVRVTCVLPGGVDTAFWDGVRDFPQGRGHMLPAGSVARAMMQTLELPADAVLRELQLRNIRDTDFVPAAE